jgi:AcrR family transcriptional regulator
MPKQRESEPNLPADRRVARRRSEDPEARRQAIAAAALEVFSAQGFAAARLEDVAARAGVAKGTVYLYFKDKEALFEHLIRSATAPILDQAEHIMAADVPFEEVLAGFYRLAVDQVLKTDRRLVIRLMLTEGRRFPAVAEFYHREVISRGVAILRRAATAAVARGQTQYRPLVEFPHLAIAPMLFAVTWDGLFSSFEHIEPDRLLAASLALITRQEMKP